MNNGIKASLALVLMALGGGFIYSALRPVHVPVAASPEPAVIVAASPEPAVIVLAEQVITPIVVTEGPGEYRPVVAKRGAARTTAKLEMTHVIGLKGETVDQIHTARHVPMVFDVDVQL